jgi:long-subunit acyl-CoA synthetase (AMP-forming)
MSNFCCIKEAKNHFSQLRLFFFHSHFIIMSITTTEEERAYGYTNLVDAVLSNDRNISDQKPIFIDADTEESINYGDFKKLIRQGTAGFLDIGLHKGDCVCLFAPNSVIFLVCNKNY